MSGDESLFREVRSAVEQGDRVRARDLLTRALRRDQDDINVWLWMSAVVDTPKERAYCLHEVLRIDPDNAAAKRGLNMMGELPPEPYSGEPQKLRKRNWQNEVVRAARTPVQLPWKKIGIFGGATVLALGLILFAIFGPNSKRNTRAEEISYDLHPTMTPTETTIPTATPTPGEPTPPWQALAATYTPTPLYVNTPHPIIEAYSLSMRAYQRGDWGKAVEYLKQSVQSEPNTADLPYLLGEAYRQTGQFSEALKAYELSLQANASFAPSYLGRALVQWSLDAGQVDQIRADLEKALQMDPRLPETLTYLGWLELSNGSPEAALERFNAAESQNLAFPITYYYRARAHLAVNNAGPALADAERAAQSDVTMLPAYLTLADALQANQRFADSVVPLEIYLRYTPNVDPAVYYKIARAYRAAGNLAAALESINKLLEEVPESSAGILERGFIYLDGGNAGSALADFDAVLQADPGSFDAGIGRARALIAMESYSDAIFQLDQTQTVVQTDAQGLEVDFWRAQALEPLDLTSAIAIWERVLSAPEGLIPDAWREMAQTRLNALYTPTPNPFLPTETPTPEPTT
ncbi:MAG: tetratricopeptide repeat protein [Bellilinea sp.]